jgi:hypothetical protein
MSWVKRRLLTTTVQSKISKYRKPPVGITTILPLGLPPTTQKVEDEKADRARLPMADQA